jgi:preprotein translocase subunit SecD
MAVLLKEKGKYTVPTAPTIQSELGSTFQITGIGSIEDANELALLLRSGALSAPMEFIEERVVGPQLGAENIAKGLHSTVWGFVAIAIFMIIYYQLFGFFSVLALAGQPAVPAGAAVDAAGDADPAGYRGNRAGARYGDRRQRADQRAHPRRAACGATPQAGDHGRLQPRLGHDFRLERDHPDRRPGAADLRFGRGARLRRRALPGHPDLDVLGRVRLARRRQPVVRPRGKKLGKLSIGTVWTPGLPG